MPRRWRKLLMSQGFRLTSGGTDNHLMLVDLRKSELTGKVAQEALDKARITVNKNAVPFDTRSPFVTSGIRLGTPAVTTRGMKEKEMEQIGDFIVRALNHVADEQTLQTIAGEVGELCRKFPVYPRRLSRTLSQPRSVADSIEDWHHHDGPRFFQFRANDISTA